MNLFGSDIKTFYTNAVWKSFRLRISNFSITDGIVLHGIATFNFVQQN